MNFDPSTIFSSLSLPPNTKSEIRFQKEESRTIGWGEGKPKVQNFSDESSTALRVLKEGKQAVVRLSGHDKTTIEKMSQEVLALCEVSPEDRSIVLGTNPENQVAKYDIDKEIFSHSFDNWLEKLSELEKQILARDRRLKKILKLTLRETRQNQEIVNSDGLSISKEFSVTGISAEILLEDNEKTEAAWDYRANRFQTHLNLDQFAANLAEEAVKSLGGKPLASGNYPIVFQPRVGIQFLNLISHALSAKSIQMGRSYFRGKKGTAVGSSPISIVDDPTLKNGLSSAGIDDEGTIHERMDVIKNGVLLDFFYDLQTANKEGRKSNGHGIAGEAALPKPSATNLFIEPGETSFDHLVSLYPQVFVLTDVMGLHMCDPITGEFSLGASGFLYKDGKFQSAVRGVTIAGTILSLLQTVEAVGREVEWYGDIGSPPFLVSKLMVGGT